MTTKWLVRTCIKAGCELLITYLLKYDEYIHATSKVYLLISNNCHQLRASNVVVGIAVAN